MNQPVGGDVDEQNLVPYAQLAPDEWKPALTAAALHYRKPYAMRHTFTSECIAAGIATFEIACIRHDVLQIEKTYRHLLPDAIERGGQRSRRLTRAQTREERHMGAGEFTPREFGLMAGNRWASRLGAEDEKVQRAAEGEVSDETREVVMDRGQMRTTLETHGEDEFSEAFWDGFIHGVRAYIVEEHANRLSNQN